MRGLVHFFLKFNIPHSKGYIPLQHMITILGHPNKMILDLELCMTPSFIFHAYDYKPTAIKMLPV